jgi:Ca2+-binding RTX toxin-like protein
MFETLESRRLLSASLARGVLTVTGTYKDDLIRIVQKETTINVTVNSLLSKFTRAKVKSVIVSGNRGDDRILLSVGSPVVLGDIAAGSTIDTTTKVMLVDGGGGNDTVDSTGGSQDTLLGGDGNDYLRAVSHRANQLSGGAGDDTLVGGTGQEDMSGGDGNDTADYSADVFNDFISLDDVANDGYRGVSFDTSGSPIFEIGGPGSEGDNVHSDIETVLGGTGDDSIVGSGADNLFIGGTGKDTLVGGGGNDTLTGDEGDDLLVGGSGKDLLNGGAGADTFLGGTGNDTADYSDRTEALVINLNDDLADDGAVSGLTHEHDYVTRDIENVIGGSGNDILIGDDKGNTFIGNGGDDQLYGNSGGDSLVGGDGDDTLDTDTVADSDIDVAIGGRGQDTVASPAANDVVRGDVEKVRYDGILHNNIVAIGGETTGWATELQLIGGGKQYIDVDVTTNNLLATATPLAGETVRVFGHFTTINYGERGPTRVIVAESLTPLATPR